VSVAALCALGGSTLNWTASTATGWSTAGARHRRSAVFELGVG